MAFTLPTFNLVCNIHTVLAGPPASNVFRLSADCNLAMGKRVASDRAAGQESGGMFGLTPVLLLAAFVDVRDSSCGGQMDVIEVPAGTGRWYLATLVDDIGKGFPNEHRAVSLYKIWNFAGNGAGLTAPWPTPIP